MQVPEAVHRHRGQVQALHGPSQVLSFSVAVEGATDVIGGTRPSPATPAPPRSAVTGAGVAADAAL